MLTAIDEQLAEQSTWYVDRHPENAGKPQTGIAEMWTVTHLACCSSTLPLATRRWIGDVDSAGVRPDPSPTAAQSAVST